MLSARYVSPMSTGDAAATTRTVEDSGSYMTTERGTAHVQWMAPELCESIVKVQSFQNATPT